MRVETTIEKIVNPLNSSIQNQLGRIERLDLEPIKYKLIKEKDWSLEAADKVEKFYKIYLQLHILYPQTIHVPTVEIDEMWHAHILDTAKYMRDCHDIFGGYLHHYPYLGMKDEADAANLDRMFGETSTRILDFLDPADHDALLSGCGGGCGGGSCGSGGDSSGPSACSTVPATPAFCGSSPGTDDRKKKKDESSKGGGSSWWPRKRSPRAPALGLSESSPGWLNPSRLKGDGRPDRDAVLALSKEQGQNALVH